jgi:hypothetical protein
MLFGLFLLLFVTVYAQEPDYSIVLTSPSEIVIYVDKEKDNPVSLTSLISANTRVHKHIINDYYAMHEGINFKKREIQIYDHTNIKYFDPNCDYDKGALDCSVQNGHWSLTSSIVREEMEASFIINLHDERGIIIGTASVPIYGKIEFQPRWKRTIIIADGLMGQQKQEVFEQWPDKKIKHPPYVRSKDISQALISLFLSFER